jgi:hypothetical protein
MSLATRRRRASKTPSACRYSVSRSASCLWPPLRLWPSSPARHFRARASFLVIAPPRLFRLSLRRIRAGNGQSGLVSLGAMRVSACTPTVSVSARSLMRGCPAKARVRAKFEPKTRHVGRDRFERERAAHFDPFALCRRFEERTASQRRRGLQDTFDQQRAPARLRVALRVAEPKPARPAVRSE